MIFNYQLKIELTGSHPKIWRRVTVPSNTPFDLLHDIIQISMGWQDKYPFEFNINKTRVRDFGAELDMGDDPCDRDAMDTVLNELVTMVMTRFTYVYNFDDRWEHQITLEKILPSDEVSEHPVCIGGERACPPDDCGGISRYKDTIHMSEHEKRQEQNFTKTQAVEPEDVEAFNIEEVNAKLRRYADEWDEIYDEAEEIIDQLEDEYDASEDDDSEDRHGEYARVKHLRSPQDLLSDESEKQTLAYRINDAVTTKDSVENTTFIRLVNQGHGEEESRVMLQKALAIEKFYNLKYGTNHFEDRYEYNLGRLPEKPVEIPSLDYAVQVLNKCTKGIPFAAIEYLHNDPSRESASVIVDALNNFSKHQYCWENCVSTPIWYALAAEGHLCEELIDPVIGFYDEKNEHATDWLHEQGQYLIGKLAQKYPDITLQKVLAAMEEDAEGQHGRAVYFLFDVFDFCEIDKYKDRLIALLKRDDLSWHDSLAITIAHLQIKEGLPVLKEQLDRLKTKKPEKGSWAYAHIVEIEEAIEQLETGEDLYPDIDTPLCLTRGKTWREEFSAAEEYFYGDEGLPGDDFSLNVPDYFDKYPESAWVPSYQQPVIRENKTGRNDPCPCGSGKKYKKCCLDKALL